MIVAFSANTHAMRAILPKIYLLKVTVFLYVLLKSLV